MKAFPHNPTIFGGRRNIFGCILAFLSFFILTFLTVKIFAPDISSDAAEKTIVAGSSAYTLSAGFEDEVEIPVTPTSSQEVYSKNHAISVNNTCPAGAKITMTSSSETSAALTRTGSDSGVKTIATTTGTTALDENSWGYSLDSGSNYSGIPLKNGTAATIYNGTKAEETTVNVLYGVRTDNDLPSGTYTTDVVYTAAVSPSCLTYTVHFDTDGGTSFDDLTLNYGDTIDLTKYIPTKSGYVFAGYSNGTDNFTGTETAANVNSTNAFAVTLNASYAAYTKDFSYTGSVQTWTVPYDGYYKIELWGAQGGYPIYRSRSTYGGYGAYTSGETKQILTKGAIWTVNVGGTSTGSYRTIGGWNGGGNALSSNDRQSSGGGGATSFSARIGSWNDAAVLRSRIMVAGGGGGASNAESGSIIYSGNGGAAGGLIGYAGVSQSGSTGGQRSGGTQISSSNGGFGYGGDGTYSQATGGGSGWYGGGGSSYCYPGSGGSSYISGHTGSVGVTSTTDSSPKSGCTTGTTNNDCSISPYGYSFVNTIMIDGAGYKWTNTKQGLEQMPNPSGGYYASGVGHSGNGAARITYLGTSI